MQRVLCLVKPGSFNLVVLLQLVRSCVAHVLRLLVRPLLLLDDFLTDLRELSSQG